MENSAYTTDSNGGNIGFDISEMKSIFDSFKRPNPVITDFVLPESGKLRDIILSEIEIANESINKLDSVWFNPIFYRTRKFMPENHAMVNFSNGTHSLLKLNEDAVIGNIPIPKFDIGYLPIDPVIKLG